MTASSRGRDKITLVVVTVVVRSDTLMAASHGGITDYGYYCGELTMT